MWRQSCRSIGRMGNSRMWTLFCSFDTSIESNIMWSKWEHAFFRWLTAIAWSLYISFRIVIQFKQHSLKEVSHVSLIYIYEYCIKYILLSSIICIVNNLQSITNYLFPSLEGLWQISIANKAISSNASAFQIPLSLYNSLAKHNFPVCPEKYGPIKQAIKQEPSPSKLSI